MKNIKTIFSILLLLPLLTGCVPIPFNEIVIPDEYYERESTIESIYPATKEDVIRQLGEPDWIKKRGSSTIFIYQSVAIEYGIGLLVVAFIPYRASDDFCLFLKFDEANILDEYLSKRAERLFFHDCLDEFYRTKFDSEYVTPYVGTLDQEIGIYCPNADLGHADAQKHIGDLYYFGSFHLLKKDLIRAYVWYSLAANSGDKGAAEQVDILTRELSPGQLSKAQSLLEEWEPGRCEKELMEANSE